MSRILLTGGAGFIGSHIAEALQKTGYSIGLLDNFDSFYPERWKRHNVQEVIQHGRCTVFECDTRDEHAVQDVFRKFIPSIVVHLAARAGVRPSIEQPILYEQVNVGGTYVVLEAARHQNVKTFILASSSSVYGNSLSLPFCEDNYSLRPISPYAATKLAAESIAYTYAHLFGFNVACLRFFTVYGPRQRPDLAIHKFTALIEKRKPIPIFGDWGSGRDYTHIEDIVEGVTGALRWCSELGGSGHFEIFNLGNSKPIPLDRLVSELEKATGKQAIRVKGEHQAGDVSMTWADIRKAEAMLGYRPKISFEDGLALFVDWYRRQPADLRG